jgi:hypothetical protein
MHNNQDTSSVLLAKRTKRLLLMQKKQNFFDGFSEPGHLVTKQPSLRNDP